MLRDKDIAGVVQSLMSSVDVWLVAGINAPRGASADELLQVLESVNVVGAGGVICAFPDITTAYAYACERATGNDRICVFGSFHTVSEVLRYQNAVKRRQ